MSHHSCTAYALVIYGDMKNNYLFQHISRISILAVSFILQILLILLFVIEFTEYYLYFQLASMLLGVVCGVSILNSDSNASYKIAWVFPLILFPVFGSIFYLIFGKSNLSSHTVKKMMIINEKQNEIFDHYKCPVEIKDDLYANRQAAYTSKYAFSPLYENRGATYFPSGEKKFQSLLRELEQAKRYIFMEYFIVKEGEMWGTILHILKQKAREGVDVRIIYDDFGCLTGLPSDYPKKLAEYNISCCVFNKAKPLFSPRFNNRDHRKICVIDGCVGFTGGVNIADEYINKDSKFGYWKDTAVMIKGEAAFSLTVMFLSMWRYVTGKDEDISRYAPDKNIIEQMPKLPGYVQPYCDNPIDSEPVGQNVYINLINAAKDYILITTPYLIIDNEMRTAICNAAKSGVKVVIVTPGIPDKKFVYSVTRANYTELLKSGVRIFEYAPGFIHAKMFICDGKYASVGTVNLDYRSLYLHFECGLWMCGTECINDILADILEVIDHSREVPNDFAKRISLRKRIFYAITRTFAPLL